LEKLARSDAADALKLWSKELPAIEWKNCPSVSIGVDWITGVSHSSATAEPLIAWSRRIYGWELKGGGIEKGWGLSGFSGFKVGQLEMGRRNEEFMVRLMSECAQLHWKKIYLHADALTRLDLQISVDIGCDPQPYIWKFFHEANSWSKRSRRGPKNDVVLGSDGGATLYCGKRKSNLFGRAYARGPKSKRKEDQNVVRFEVQFNKRLALLVARDLAQAKSAGDFCRDRVVQFFRNRGVHVDIPFGSSETMVLPRRRTDLHKRLLWLEQSVRKSCELLAARGELEATIRALGLDAYVTINH